MDRTQIWLNGLHQALTRVHTGLKSVADQADDTKVPYNIYTVLQMLDARLESILQTIPVDPEAFERPYPGPVILPPAVQPTVGRPLVAPRGSQDLQEELEDIEDDDDEKAKKEGAEQMELIRRMGEVPEPEQPGVPAEDLSATTMASEQVAVGGESPFGSSELPGSCLPPATVKKLRRPKKRDRYKGGPVGPFVPARGSDSSGD